MRFRALLAALGAACAAGAAVAALTVGSGPTRPRFSSSSSRLLPATRPGSCGRRCDDGSTSLRLYRIDGAAAATVLPGIRACHALRFTSVDRPAGTLSTTDFADPLVPTEWWRGDRRRRPDAARPREGRHDRRFRRRLAHPEFAGRPNLRRSTPRSHSQSAASGTAVASVIGAGVNGVGSSGSTPRPVLQSGTPPSALAPSSQRATSSRAFWRRRAPAPA